MAVTLGAAAGVGLVAATSSEPSSFVPITPERILDTRPGNDLGLTGSFVSTEGRDLQVTGNVPTPSASIAADGEVRGGVGVGDVTMTTSPANRYVVELTDTTFGNDTNVAAVTPVVVDPPTTFQIDPCEQAHPSTSADAGKLVVSITTSLDYESCEFSVVVYRLQ